LNGWVIHRQQSLPFLEVPAVPAIWRGRLPRDVPLTVGIDLSEVSVFPYLFYL